MKNYSEENKKLKNIITNLAYIAEAVIEKVDIICSNTDNDVSRELAPSLVELQYAIKQAKDIKDE